MKAMLPNALLFQATKKSLDDPVLLRGVRGDEPLRQSVVPTSCPKPPALEDQPVVAAHHRGLAGRPQGAKAGNTGLLDRSLGFPGPTAQRKLPTQKFPIVTVDHPDQVGPAITTAVHMGQIHRPAAIASCGAAHGGFHARPRCHGPLMHQPTLGPQNAVNPFPVDPYPQPIAQQGPQSPIAIRGVLSDQ